MAAGLLQGADPHKRRTYIYLDSQAAIEALLTTNVKSKLVELCSKAIKI